MSEQLKEFNITNLKIKNQYVKYKLKQDVPTRWNSTYLMIKSIVESSEGIKYVLNVETNHKHIDHCLNNFEFAILEELIELLEPIFQFTEMLSGK